MLNNDIYVIKKSKVREYFTDSEISCLRLLNCWKKPLSFNDMRDHDCPIHLSNLEKLTRTGFIEIVKKDSKNKELYYLTTVGKIILDIVSEN